MPGVRVGQPLRPMPINRSLADLPAAVVSAAQATSESKLPSVVPLTVSRRNVVIEYLEYALVRCLGGETNEQKQWKEHSKAIEEQLPEMLSKQSLLQLEMVWAAVRTDLIRNNMEFDYQDTRRSILCAKVSLFAGGGKLLTPAWEDPQEFSPTNFFRGLSDAGVWKAWERWTVAATEYSATWSDIRGIGAGILTEKYDILFSKLAKTPSENAGELFHFYRLVGKLDDDLNAGRNSRVPMHNGFVTGLLPKIHIKRILCDILERAEPFLVRSQAVTQS